MNIIQVDPEMTMRSFWMNRLFHLAYAGDRVSTQVPLSVPALPPKRGATERVLRAQATNSPRSQRLCLGIGDGSVHRQ
ncbi:hypothetical protein [Dyella caseinilytica]|uniref:Uncharacterized protein n=1 Tax=Dyella caseinilytica TaxID=1849581 RepID=A0ABX7GUC6_9GAMM|nr:hypothetical protein [Dyella caseinilytica]QRN54055.1 hypothetical protein ISN74_01210 [Dyella caseinilytica]GFZ91248.1 hypothetical protein GCM10011408_08120 [Dyella caseinilytica]